MPQLEARRSKDLGNLQIAWRAGEHPRQVVIRDRELVAPVTDDAIQQLCLQVGRGGAQQHLQFVRCAIEVLLLERYQCLQVIDRGQVACDPVEHCQILLGGGYVVLRDMHQCRTDVRARVVG